jgi:N-formylglutamate deformylase
MSAALPPRVQVSTAAEPAPLVFDSPHSGTDYPADFAYVCDLADLRRAEDFRVDALFDFTPALGATLISATFPRSYLDVNRAPEDIDPELLPPHERGGAVPSVKSNLGMGLVWRLLDGEVPIYAGPLRRAQIDARIERCWQPYHLAVTQAIGDTFERHGRVLHVNCHSMPSQSRLYPAAIEHRMPFDFLLGDRDGSTASPHVTNFIAEFLRGEGFVVGINQVFKGVELVRRYGAPAKHRHSVQLEINRALYMDEERHQAHDGFATVRGILRRLAQALVTLDVRTEAA